MQQNSDRERNFLKRISDRLLFIRSASESEVTKLTSGRRDDLAYKKWPLAHTTTIGGMIERDDLTKKYSLPSDFCFDLECSEFVVTQPFYDGFKSHLEEITTNNPGITLDEILSAEYAPQRSFSKNRKAGRPKAKRDPATGKLVNINKKASQQIDLWEETGDVEAVRSALNPATRLPITKAGEIKKIKRNLRRYNHLLTRPYNTK